MPWETKAAGSRIQGELFSEFKASQGYNSQTLFLKKTRKEKEKWKKRKA
jgi:hypothetical protein